MQNLSFLGLDRRSLSAFRVLLGLMLFFQRYVLSRIASLRAKRFQVFILANTNILVYVLDFRLSRREIIQNEADDTSSLPKGTTQGSDLKNPD